MISRAWPISNGSLPNIGNWNKLVMALFDMNECRVSCYQQMLCPQEEVSGTAEARNPYRVWLARKVETAVEKALQHEGQKKMLEDYALSRKLALPQMCEERRLVSTKIHSLLLQWKPDFSAQWGLKVRCALPMLETIFSLMACCIEDYSQPLLVEPRLKEVLCLIDSLPCRSKSSPSSTQQSLAMLFNHQDLCRSAEHTDHAVGKARVCKTSLYVEGEETESACQHAGLAFGMAGVMVHDACNGASAYANIDNLDEGNISDREHNSSPLCMICLQSDRPLERSDAETQKACSCRPSATEELDDDSLEWSKINLHTRGTVAMLMASELRSSRKEKANQALLNAIASKDAHILEDNWNKHGKFASKWIVKKIMELQKRSSKKERDLCFKRVVDKLLHASAEEKCPNAWVPTQMKRSTSKGILGFLGILCHTPTSKESDFTFAASHPSNLVKASEKTACCLSRVHSKPAAGQNVYAPQAKLPLACLRADHDRDDLATCCQTSHDDFHPPNNNEVSSQIGSTCGFSSDLDTPGGALECHHESEADSLARQGCLEGEAQEPSLDSWPFNAGSDGCELNIAACSHIEDDDAAAHVVACPNIQDGNVISTDEDRAKKDGLDRHSDVSWSEPGNSNTQGLPLVSSADRSLIERREGTSICPEEYEGPFILSTDVSDVGLQGGLGVMQANMQTSDLYRDRELELELEPEPLPGIVIELEDCITPSTMLPAEEIQNTDQERQDGRRRARVPLSSLLAEREDWSTRNPTVSLSSCTDCAWDTWEEPSEALDPFCCVCMIGLRGAAFTPCGHTFCRKCSRELWKVRGSCPLCNKLITGILDIF